MNKYEKLWNELRSKVSEELKYYKDGYLCSLAESIHGENNCRNFIKMMNRLEEENEPNRRTETRT